MCRLFEGEGDVRERVFFDEMEYALYFLEIKNRRFLQKSSRRLLIRVHTFNGECNIIVWWKGWKE